MLTITDPVYSGREFTSIWSYVLKHGTNVDRFFEGIDIPRERILTENEWFDIHTTIKIWENYRACLPDYDMTESFQLSYESTRNASFGIAKLFTQFSSLKLIMKLLPYLAGTVSKIDLFDILELKDTSAIITYNAYPGFEEFIDSSHIFGFMGLFAAFPTIHNKPMAKVREVTSLIDVFKKFRIDFAQFNHTIEEKDGIIYLDNVPAGKRIIITKNQNLDPIAHKYLSGEACILWEKDVQEIKKNGHKIFIAKKGDLYNCSQSIFSMQWENKNFFKRLRTVVPELKQYLTAFFKTREAMFIQTSQLHDQSNTLQKRIKEKTDEVYRAQAEIHKLETLSRERKLAGGFAHEMRNALTGAQLELHSILDYKNMGTPASDQLKNAVKNLLININELSQKFDIPQEKITAHIIPDLKSIVEISEHFSDSITGISRDLNRSLKITDEIRKFTLISQAEPGFDLIDISLMLRDFGTQYKKEFKKRGIHYTVEGEKEIVIEASKGHLESIFSNLILNARDALKANSTQAKICIAIEKDCNQVLIRVQDNGSGIAEKHLAEIFDPFFSTKPSTGTGLGLGIVQKLVTLYKGQITVESNLNKGSTFEVTFPGSLVL